MSDTPSPTRRTFIRSTAMAALASGVASIAARRPEGDIDAHVHVWTPDKVAYPWAPGATSAYLVTPSFTPEQLFAHCRPQGVDRIVLIQMSFYRFDNRYMLDAIAQHPGVFVGVAVVDESAPDVRATMRQLARQKVKGFRLLATHANVATWQDSPGMNAMWAEGADSGLAMCLLADPAALPAIHRMCERYPKTPVVIDHLSRIGMDGTIRQSDIDELKRIAAFEQTHVKVSAFYALGAKKAPYTDLGPMIRQLRDAYGASRLMWASDCPFAVCNGYVYADSIGLVRDRLDFLTAEDKSWILRRSAEKFFFS